MNHRETLITEQGQTMAEYAVVLTVITVAIVATLSVLSSSIINLVTSVVTAM
jgi:Flp pilus assembly pilin Flp